MEPGPSDVIGSFFYIDWATDDINNIYTNSFSSEALSGFAQPYIVLDPKPALQFKAAEESSSDSSIDSETEARLQDIEEAPYDHSNAPKMGYLYQCDMEFALDLGNKDTKEVERAKAGELVWSPEQLSEAEVDRYLAETQCLEGQDVDEFFQPWRNREWDASGQLVPSAEAVDVDPTKPLLCTQEHALLLLHRAGYDAERAKAELGARNLVWSAKRRDIEPWTDHDVFKFESNMRLSKPFHDLPQHVPGKTVKDIMHFYYTWKKTPRYANWRKRRSTGLPIREQAPVVYDAPSGAPLKEDEFAALRQFMGLRSRPRVDYSQSSSGHHIWRSTTSGFKRKQRQDDESSDTDDEKSRPALTVYEVRVEADINLEALRMAKRRRVNEDGSYTMDSTLPLPSDDALIMEVEQHERDVLTRGPLDPFAEEPNPPVQTWDPDM